MLRRIGLAVLLACGPWMAADALAHDPEQEPDIRLLREAAAALTTSRPDLAKALTDYADREAQQAEEEEGENGRDEGSEHHEDDAGPREHETR